MALCFQRAAIWQIDTSRSRSPSMPFRGRSTPMPETEKAPSKEALEAAVKLMRDVFSWEDAMLLTAPGRGAVGSVAAAMEAFAAEQNVDLQVWVNDLQSGLYVNCVYCGHCYGPRETTPVSMADALKAHVEQCPKHPRSE